MTGSEVRPEVRSYRKLVIPEVGDTGSGEIPEVGDTGCGGKYLKWGIPEVRVYCYGSRRPSP